MEMDNTTAIGLQLHIDGLHPFGSSNTTMDHPCQDNSFSDFKAHSIGCVLESEITHGCMWILSDY